MRVGDIVRAKERFPAGGFFLGRRLAKDIEITNVGKVEEIYTVNGVKQAWITIISGFIAERAAAGLYPYSHYWVKCDNSCMEILSTEDPDYPKDLP